MGDPSPMGMIDRRQDRLEERVEDLEKLTEEIPVLRNETKLLREAFNRNTNALYTAAVSMLTTGVLGVLAALILKGTLA
jgi:hypothetical protein